MQTPHYPAPPQRTIGGKFSHWLERHIIDQEGHIDYETVADEVDRILSERGVRQ